MKSQHSNKTGWLILGFLIAGVAATFAKPDMTVDRYLLRVSGLVERQYFTTTDCNYVEGCTKIPGLRKLFKVDVGLVNIGKGDLVIGAPEDHPGLFVWSPCHQHYHMKTMVHYRLLNMNFAPVTTGRKQAFCLRDNYPYLNTAGASTGYNCGYQGITRGWEDVYDKSLDCQYLDVTGVPPGQYYLEVEVNPLHVFDEATYSNNKVMVRVTIPRLN